MNVDADRAASAGAILVAPGEAATRASPPSIGRPIGRRFRLLHAYAVTFLVCASYLSLKLQSRVRGAESLEALARRKHRTNARRIERAIARLQGLFIKVGQLFSIMTNFLPDEFRAELSGLQDAVPARPYADIERRIHEEFGRGPREVWAEFTERPVASASIGQVHVARTHEGERVAVKVQYPDIEEIVRLDLRALRSIFAVIGWFLPYQGLDAVYREIREMVLQELDFRLEADHIERIAENFARRPAQGASDLGVAIGFPRVLRPLSTARVLTTEWIDGVKMADGDRLESLGLDRRRLARAIVHAYCQQIFTDGLYHADPHPGNLLAQLDATGAPKVFFIDFGAVAEVSPRMRLGIIELIQAGLARDTPRLIAAMKGMGFIARNADAAVFERVVDYLHQKFQEEVKLESFSLADIKFDPQRGLEKLADLRRMDVSLRDLTEHFHVPKEWIMLERTALLLVGLCTELDRDLNPMVVIRPYLEEFVVGKERDFSAFVVETTRDVALSAVALPGDIKKFIARSMRGELEVRFRGVEEHARLLYTLGHQLIYVACGVTSAFFWLALDERGRVAEATWAARGTIAFAAITLLSFMANRPRGKKR